MHCPYCGAELSRAGSFCMRCGAKLTSEAITPAPTAYRPAPSQPVAAAPTDVDMPVRAVGARERNAVVTIRHISAGSAFKVTFVTYLLLLGLIGLLVVVLPGLLGAGLLGSLVDDRFNVGALGGGIVVTLVTYVVLVVGGAIGPAILMALSAMIYNLVASWVGGIRVRLEE